MAERYSYIFFRPERVNILEGFTTNLVVMGVPVHHPGKVENVTSLVTFHVKGPEGAISIVKQPDTSFVQVKGVRSEPAPSLLYATLKSSDANWPQLEAKAFVTVDESDLLLFAPDGHVYWVTTEMWMKAEKFPIDSKRLNPALHTLLRNETVVANIPNIPYPDEQAAQSSTPSAAGRAEPITCFLLNLNSILLSYTPSTKLRPAEQDPSPPIPGTEP
ncbi:hypothetical protein [Myxococcus landrumensis]|uniref:Lipoprotein n=1 Tax=Myxococcus landrumensis TaxID=2813577 RepID=A0ABX7N4I4_9BACT|nr:hypothetical protein [Myxococcus landrumus]QSQ13620.1 hypothetical protein JY572_35665 [Myxococcus landrumus]